MANVNLDTNPLPTFGYDTSQPWDPSTAGSAPPLGQGGPPVRATYTPPPDTGAPITAPSPVQFDPGTGQPIVKLQPPANDPTQAGVDRTLAQQASSLCSRHICPPDFQGMIARLTGGQPPLPPTCLCWSDLLAYGGLFLVTLLGATFIVASRRGSGV